MLYRMVTGWLPFAGTTIQMIHAHAYETPPAPSTRAKVSPDLERVIMKALAKDPVERFPDGRTMPGPRSSNIYPAPAFAS
jgi:serine/threonine-protein kinase